MKTVLIVDDDARTLKELKLFAERLGLTVLVETSGGAAIRKLMQEDQEIDAVVTDTRMDYGDGIEVLQTILRLDFRLPLKVLIHSGDKNYRYGGKDIKLAGFVSEYFGTFAKFRLKGVDYQSAKAFLTEVAETG